MSHAADRRTFLKEGLTMTVATLAATGGVVTAQPGGAPSTSDFKPRCCP